MATNALNSTDNHNAHSVQRGSQYSIWCIPFNEWGTISITREESQAWRKSETLELDDDFFKRVNAQFQKKNPTRN